MSTELLRRFMETPVIQRQLWLYDVVQEAVTLEGHFLEFGVGSGSSLRAIKNAVGARVVHGFDTFEGLPEDWVKGPEKTFPKGSFISEPPNVIGTFLHVGDVAQTLPRWLAVHTSPVAFVHFDMDLYAPTRLALDLLTECLAPGAVLVFDELCCWDNHSVYPNYMEHEWKALTEWAEVNDFAVAPFLRDTSESGAVRVFRRE